MKNIFKTFISVKNPHRIYLYCVGIGVVMGFISVGIAKTLHFFESNFLDGLSGTMPTVWSEMFHLGSFGIFFLPLIGGLIVTCLAKKFPEIVAAGTNDLIGSFHEKEGRMRGAVAPALAVASVAALATGASAGKEGPTAVIGGVVGSTFSRWFGLGPRARRTLLLAGAAAGLGAIFRAPLGGAITAVEIPYKEDFEGESLIPCIIASISAYIVAIIFWEEGHLFKADAMMINNTSELWIYAFLGVVTVVLGRLFIKMLILIQRFTQKIPLDRTWHPLVGSVLLGALILICPSVLGTGFSKIQEAISGTLFINGNVMGLVLCLVLFVIIKMLATGITVGSGLAGGLFGPSFVIGGMTGAIVGVLAQYYFPDIVASPVPFVVVGMGAFFAGVAHAPLASVIMVVELTGSYELFPAILVAVAVGIALSGKDTIYPRQLKNKFDSPAHLWDMKKDILQNIKVKDLAGSIRSQAVVENDITFGELERIGKQTHASDFIVVDKDRKYQGYVSLRHSDVDHIISKFIVITDILSNDVETTFWEESLSDVMEKILRSDIDKIAVVDNEHNLKGYIRYRDILDTYIREVASSKSLKNKTNISKSSA
ncbi:chloride channel protein [PVC group bacterium]|nr:chloride channel protein [PVC group bacterium]